MYKLGDKFIDNCGSKAKLLSMLKSRGYNIPLGVVIEFEEFKNIIKTQNLNIENINEIEIPDDLINRIFDVIPQGKNYAIRSSININDVRNLSLAGRFDTYLNVAKNADLFKEKIKACYLSMYSANNLQFYRKNKVDISKIEMNIIIQEMIDSNASGILFTVNPINGKDSQIVIEFSRGAGTVVSGKDDPQRIVYDWMEEKYVEEPKINILGDSAVRKIINIALTLQQDLGCPVDVEFGVYDSKLYIFQVRQINKIENREVYYRYINTNPQILSPFISSINEKVDTSVAENLITNLRLSNELLDYKPVSVTKYCRNYWNLSQLKGIAENIPGYIERNLDEYLNVNINYLDNGKSNIGNNRRKIRVVQKKNIVDIIRKQCINIGEARVEYSNKIAEYENKTNITSEVALKENIHKLITYYYNIKTACAWQEHLNLLLKINLNDSLGNILNNSEMNSLFGGIENEYNNAPVKYMWDMSRFIRNDQEKMNFFDSNLDAEIFYIYRKDKENPNIKGFLTDFLSNYGYHSFNENDIIYKTYEEEVLRVIRMFRDFIESDDSAKPFRELAIQNSQYEKTMNKLSMSLKKSQYKNVVKDIEFLREQIRNVFELNNFRIILQCILRKYMIELGKIYKTNYILEDEEDIFYLDYIQVLNESIDNLKNNINKNKIYFNSFRNYNPTRDIYPIERPQINMENSKVLSGIGVSGSRIKGRVKIVKEKEDLKDIKENDIVFVEFLDTDIFKDEDLDKVKGIVAQYGGTLCHMAINSRERGIACIVSVKDLMDNIHEGDIVQLNCETGEIVLN